MNRTVAAAGITLLAAVSPAAAESLGDVESRIFTIRDFRLESGAVLPEVQIAYETYGKLAGDGRNAVLATHGYTSSHHVAGRYKAGAEGKGLATDDLGSWDGLIGPGKAVDTDRLFVVSSNMLGSSYGSTNAASTDPKTGKQYGPTFPDITLADIVGAQKALLDHLGVKHLIAVIGPSFGGYQAFQWAVTYPEHMHGIVASVTAPKGSGGDQAVRRLVDQLATDPAWNDGWYYDKGGPRTVVTKLRADTLKRYGAEQQLAAKFPDPVAREAEIQRQAGKWAENFDAHSLVILRRASVRFDAEKDFGKIKAKVLYVLSSTDKLFPPTIAPAVMDKLKAAGVDATYFQLESDYGHMATGKDAEKWSPALRAFMDRLVEMEARRS